MVDEPGLGIGGEFDQVGAAFGRAEDARTFGVTLAMGAPGLAGVALGDEEAVYHTLHERLAPIDLDTNLDEPVAFGLRLHHPKE